MSRLPMLSPKRVIGVLEKSGFIFVRQVGGHARYVHSSNSERYATVALHPGDIPRKELASILRQSKISREEFLSLL